MWCDEPAVWLHQQDTWDMAILGMRKGGRFLGDIPQCIVTSTPKSNQLILYLIDQSYDRLESRGELPPHLLEKRIVARNGQPLKVPKMRVVITKGSTYENKSNLPPSFFANLISKYEGTKLGRQELEAELVPDSPGALWRRAWIDDLRVENASPLIRTCIGVDPSGAVGETANACGIIVAGIGEDNHQYILGDASGVMTPAQWGKIVVELFVRTQANAIVAERNFGGLMVEEVIRGAARQMGVFIPPIVLLTASKAKKIRGEPVASLYEGRPGSKERGIVHHVGIFLELEDELCSWDPSKDKKSPNRLDALVWAIHWLNRWHEPQVAIY
jgi:phage terminase large subunit-like protein